MQAVEELLETNLINLQIQAKLKNHIKMRRLLSKSVYEDTVIEMAKSGFKAEIS